MSATFSFNLIDQPWIPCIDLQGRYAELSLWEMLANAPNMA
jgi:hypothetical protein